MINFALRKSWNDGKRPFFILASINNIIQVLKLLVSVAFVGLSGIWSFLLMEVGGHSVQLSVWIPPAGWYEMQNKAAVDHHYL